MSHKKDDIFDKEIHSNGQEQIVDQDTTTETEEVVEEVSPDETDDSNTADQQEQITKLEATIDELKDKNLRLLAEFENVRRRVARERIELVKTASQDVLVNLLPILDDFERAFKASEEAEDTLPEGFNLIYQKLKASVANKGLKEMACIGESFDTSFHEAIAEVPAPTKKLKGKIIDVVEKGYYLHEKIIRYAKVVVGK